MSKLKLFFINFFPALIVSFLLVILVYAWTAPSASPPEGNVPAPINVGSSTQFKLGALGVGGVFQASGGSGDYVLNVVDGKVGIGVVTSTSLTALLHIRGTSTNPIDPFKVELPLYGILSGWNYRRKINIYNNTDKVLKDYQVLVELKGLSMKDDCSDLRFTDEDGGSELSYWIESCDRSGTTKVWVKVPEIPIKDRFKTIYVYYGNEEASSESNPYATFYLFENWESENLNGWESTYNYECENCTTPNPWRVSSTTSYKGEYSLIIDQSIPNSLEYASINKKINASMNWRIEFYWTFVQNDPGDSISFKINNETKKRSTGTLSRWTKEVFTNLPAGENITIEWFYDNYGYLNRKPGVSYVEIDYIIARGYAPIEPTVVVSNNEETVTSDLIQQTVFFINPNGNMGIWTANPSGKISISSGWGNWLTFDDKIKGNQYVFHNPAEGGRFEVGVYDSASSTMRWGVFVIKPSGNIGIGTTNPEGKFDIFSDYIEYIKEGTQCGEGDIAIAYKTESVTCGDRSSGCKTCTTDSHDWNDNPNPETCEFEEPLSTTPDPGSIQCLPSTCYAKVFVKCTKANRRVFQVNNSGVYIRGNVGIEIGNVGIGTTNPISDLHVEGSAYISERLKIATKYIPGFAHDKAKLIVGDPGNQNYALSNWWKVFSSIRWKENIKPINNALDKILKLQGVYFDWKGTKKHDIGLIAEDVGKIIPEVVTYDEKDRRYAESLDYSRLVPVLIEAIKEQQKEIDELKKQLHSF